MDKSLEKISADNRYHMNGEEWLKEKYNEIMQTDIPYSFISLNIKKFKFFNFKYGWKGANEIIYLIYQTLEATLQDNEYVAHIGGDTYNLLIRIENYNLVEDFEKYIAQVFMKFIDAVFEIDDSRIYRNLYCSFGFCPLFYEKYCFLEAQEMAELARRAEKNIHLRTFTAGSYHDDVLKDYMKQCEMEIQLTGALKRNEYKVFIQPKVDVKTFKIVGGEALLRRFDQEGKPIPLSEFLPTLNEMGYIGRVDLFVFQTVCQRIKEAAKRKEAVVPVSFNISKTLFYNDILFDEFMSSFEELGISRDYVEFELMESISLDDTSRMIDMINKIKQEGFSCSLDDFGNGYSSFCVLLNGELDSIKLDRQFFVKNLNGDNKIILKGIVDMLHSLGLKVIAEGVETKDYVDYLGEIGCDIIQGYYFYKPMPLEEFMQLL